MTSETARRLFAEKVMPHLDDAFALAKWLTGNATDAEDVVQEACVRALRVIETSNVQRERAWLLAIVRNTAFTWLARNRPAKVIVTDDMEQMVHASGMPRPQTPEESVIARADAALLERAIDALPLAFREALVMREFSDMSYRDIAEATQSPIGTVMSRLARARGMLAASLAAALGKGQA